MIDSSLFVLDKPELLIDADKGKRRWKSSLNLPNDTLEKNYATRAILSFFVGARCNDSYASSQIFAKPSDIDAHLGDHSMLVAQASGYKALEHNSCLTIVNLSVDSAFDYGLTASPSTAPLFSIYLVGYYTETTSHEMNTMKCFSLNKKQKNHNHLSLVLLDVPELLISTSVPESSWKNSNDLPSTALKTAKATKAIVRLCIGVNNMDDNGVGEIFMKKANTIGNVGNCELRVATAFTKKNQTNNICMTIVNLDAHSAFSYAFTSNTGTLPIFEMYLMGYYE